MKTFLAGALVAGVLAVPASAQAPTVQSLQHQVTLLQRQNRAQTISIAALQGQVTALQNRLQTDEQTYNSYPSYIGCDYALSQDGIANDWHVINLVAAAALHISPEPDLPRVDDKGACAAIGVTR